VRPETPSPDPRTLPPRSARLTPQRGRGAGGETLAVLEWPGGQSAVAKFGFEVGSGRLLRMRIRDTQSGAEATIDFGDYRSVGGLEPTSSPQHSRVFGLTWPQRMEVRGKGLEFNDVLSNLELTP
jgi:hypothetical protein